MERYLLYLGFVTLPGAFFIIEVSKALDINSWAMIAACWIWGVISGKIMSGYPK